MASDGEDDYLSDKFLFESTSASTSSKPLAYADRRKQAQRQAEIKNVQNRKKSRRKLEEEAREKGLKRSLFERAKADEEELGLQNKAMSIMLKMGFKPGEALGRSSGEPIASTASASAPAPSLSICASASPVRDAIRPLTETTDTDLQHRAVPISVDMWSGKKGVGLGKRAVSPGAAERLAKAARLGEEADKETYRSRTRAEYEERRAAGRLLSATQTLLMLDEKAGVQFNVMSLSPQDPTAFPSELLDALSDGQIARASSFQEPETEWLRRQMRIDALQPLEPDSESGGELEKPKPSLGNEPLSPSLSDETIEEAKAFLQLNARDRLKSVLRYLRQKHNYCFWCGTQYSDRDDLDGNCPGEDEDAHD